MKTYVKIQDGRMVARRNRSGLDRGPKFRVLEAVKYYLRATGGRMPSYEMVSERSGVSLRMVPDYIRILEKQGYIKQKHQDLEEQTLISK